MPPIRQALKKLYGFGEKAEVSETKIVKYLLSTTHRAGKSKAAFFIEFGFDPQKWEQLDRARRQHAMDNEIARQERTIFGSLRNRRIFEGSRRTIIERPHCMVYRQ
jgi:hypothetical protein